MIPEALMSTGRVLLEWNQEIATLTLSQPERRNALNQAMWSELRSCLHEAADNPPRALLVTGSGGHFSAGADLQPDNPMFAQLLKTIQQKDSSAARRLIRELKATADLLAAFPAPTIAAIEGNCVGGGLELALACDIRVAAHSARLGLPEVRLGFIPDIGGTARLTHLLGPGRAAEMILTARLVKAEEALFIGLCQRLCADGEALTTAQQMAEDIRHGGPEAVRLALQTIRQAPDLGLHAAQEVETEAAVGAMTSGEVLEGATAFLQKRPPRWQTR